MCCTVKDKQHESQSLFKLYVYSIASLAEESLYNMLQQILLDKFGPISAGLTNTLHRITGHSVADKEAEAASEGENISRSTSDTEGKGGRGGREVLGASGNSFWRRGAAKQKSSATVTRNDHYVLMDFSSNSRKYKHKA